MKKFRIECTMLDLIAIAIWLWLAFTHSPWWWLAVAVGVVMLFGHPRYTRQGWKFWHE